MKFSRNKLAFGSVLTAGLLLAAASFVLPSVATYGSETDAAVAAADAAREKAISDYLNGSTKTTTQAPAPPAAPLDNNTPSSPAPAANAPAPSADNTATGGGQSPASLPSTGNGGYLNSTTSTNYGFMLIGIGVALMGSGSLVWAVSRRRR